MTAPPPVAPRVERPYKRLSPLTPLVRSSLLLVAVLASTWDDILRGNIGPIAWILLAIVLAGLVYGTASWLRTKYWIEADELRVDTGVVSKQSRRIRVDRIQGIDIAQPFVARILGLAELRMDVAGGGSKEGSLAFLSLKEAQDLRVVLLARRDAVRSQSAPGPDSRAPDSPDRAAPASPPTEPAAERLLARLDLLTLVVSLLLSVETVLFVVAALTLGGVFLALGQIGGVATVVPVLGGFALTQFRKLSAYYRFTVTEGGGALHVRRGLFALDTQTVTLSRVQGLVVTEPLMWRALGWAKLDVALAGSSHSEEDGKPSASTVMPVAPRALVMSLARTLLSESGGPVRDDPGLGPDPDLVSLSAPPRRAQWVAPVGRHFLAAGVGADVVVGREGVLSRRTHVVPHARVQSVQLHQGPWQRRLGLADLLVDSPPGPVKVRARHRDAAQARALFEQEGASSARARHA